MGKCTNAKQNRLTRFDNALIIPQESLCYPRARLSSLVVVISSLVMEVRSRQPVADFLGGGGQCTAWEIFCLHGSGELFIFVFVKA